MITFEVDNLKSMNAKISVFADFLKSRDIADEDVFLSRLVSSELISNVIRHGGDTAEFKGELLVDKISITVTAASQADICLNPAMPGVLAESGRGLYIINAVSMNGIERLGSGVLRVYIKRTK